MKVLVVDTDASRAPALTQTLRAGGAEVTVTPSGSFALTLLERNHHDVVVSRARLEDMEGHELCTILKADPGTRDVRFVLVAGPDELTSAETAAAGVDLVLPAAMTGSAIVPLILRLMQGDRAPAPEPAVSSPVSGASAATPSPVASAPPLTGADTAEPAPPVPRIRPEPMAPPQAEPPKRYATVATAAASSPWSKSTPAVVPPSPAVGAPPTSPRPGLPTAPAVPSTPTTAAAGTAAPASPQAAALLAIPSGTFQGSLEVMDLADLVQAVAGGGKNGRLILALPQGGGLMVFDKGCVVHAEYRNTVGEEAFGALLAASHGEAAGRFCFLPTKAGQSSGVPRTIDKTVDRLLLSSATAIDEKG